MNINIVQVSVKPTTRRVMPAIGIVERTTPDGTLAISVENVPNWLRRMERSRGVFSNGPVRMNLFRNHKLNWSWDMDIFCEFNVTI